jgi:PAS domain-containing protein
VPGSEPPSANDPASPYSEACDHSRRITEIFSRLNYDWLERDVETVQRTLAVVEQEVHPKGNCEAAFLMRIRPYRTLDDRLDGVVITFVDVTAMKRTEMARRDLELSFQLAQEAAGVGAWRWDIRTNAMQCTPESMKLMGHEPGRWAALLRAAPGSHPSRGRRGV